MTISLKEYPVLSLAHQLTNGFENAIIAGGFPRDLLTDKKPDDIDIFVPSCSDIHLVESTLKAAKFAQQHSLTIEACEYYVYDRCKVMRLKIGDNIDLCLASSHWATPEQLVLMFDMVASQAWLERTEDGFIAHATDLFYELNNRKVLVFFPGMGG